VLNVDYWLAPGCSGSRSARSTTAVDFALSCDERGSLSRLRMACWRSSLRYRRPDWSGVTHASLVDDVQLESTMRFARACALLQGVIHPGALANHPRAFAPPTTKSPGPRGWSKRFLRGGAFGRRQDVPTPSSQAQTFSGPRAAQANFFEALSTHLVTLADAAAKQSFPAATLGCARPLLVRERVKEPPLACTTHAVTRRAANGSSSLQNAKSMRDRHGRPRSCFPARACVRAGPRQTSTRRVVAAPDDRPSLRRSMCTFSIGIIDRNLLAHHLTPPCQGHSGQQVGAKLPRVRQRSFADLSAMTSATLASCASLTSPREPVVCDRWDASGARRAIASERGWVRVAPDTAACH